MEFDNIHLPTFVVAGLYKHTLVLLEDDIVVGNWALATVGGGQFIDGGEPVIKKITHTDNIAEAPLATKEPIVNPMKQQLPILTSPILVAEQIGVTPHPLPIKYLGGFGKKISIVLEEHFHLHINDGDLAFLAKLLQACQLSLNDVAIINVVSNKSNINQLWQLMPAEKMIIFEVDPGSLGLPFRLSHFKLQPWSDCIFLASPSLVALQAGASEPVVQLKRNLWENLKKMFLT